MSRPPNIPSHPGPPHSYNPHPVPHAGPSRPETNTQSQHVHPRDQNHAQQLPSLRTLLEPELLDKRPTDPPPRTSAAQYAHGSPARFESSSPTLKRRHDFDGYAHGHPEHNAIVSQTSYHDRQPLSSATTDSQSGTSSTPGSAFSASHIVLQRHHSFAHPSHHDQADNFFRPSSTASDTATTIATPMAQENIGDADRPVRRRIDGSSRAPVRSSRCVGQREIQGEGLCYIYEDGTYCRAIIDGETVNPDWGITKAGKPRKRLAQACLTCREKKIKCEPGYPKCLQCAKSQRLCRGGVNLNASGEISPSHPAPMYKNSSVEVLNPAGRPENSRAPGELREYPRKLDSWNGGTPLRSRHFRPTSGLPSRDMSVQSLDSEWSGSGNDQDVDGTRPGSDHDQLAVQWEQDPHDMDPRLTMHLLDLYFLYAGRATFGLFPRRPFIAWVKASREKNQDHLMLLYTTLAIGSLFSADPDKRALGKQFAAVASYAAERRFGKFTLQLCQSRLLLALYFFARGRSQEAWDFCGAGLRAISALKLNSEEGIKELVDSTADLDFGFDRWTYQECCRRTFWSGLLMDRYNGFYGSTLLVISIEDAYVRLPCPDDMYDASTPCEAPYYDEAILNGQGSPQHLGHMAYLCLVSAIWGEVLTFTGRASHGPVHGYEGHYEAFYTTTHRKLEAWRTMLPPNLQYSSQNLDDSILEGHAGVFMSLHSLYHAAIIRLNRHVRVEAMPTDKLRRNIEESFRSANTFMSMMRLLAAVNRQRLPLGATSDFWFTTPFSAYTMMLSIDVLTSAGTYSSMPSLIDTVGIATSCMDELAGFWASARAQQKAISSRLKRLQQMAVQEGQGVRNGSHGHHWKIDDSLETAFGNDDAVYRADGQLLFDIVAPLTGH